MREVIIFSTQNKLTFVIKPRHMRTLALLVTAFLLFSFQQATEFYHIIKVDGTIVNTATGKPLAPGDNIKPNDQLKFNSPYASALVISNTRGKFTLKYQSTESKDLFNDNKELLAMANTTVTPIDSRGMLATRGIGISEVKDLKSYFGTENFYVIGNSLSVKLNKTAYPLNDKQGIVFSYSQEDKEQSKRIGFSNQYLKIVESDLVPGKMLKDTAEPVLKDINVYKIDDGGKKSENLTRMNLVFMNDQKLKDEFDVIIPFLKDQKLERFKVIDYLKSYFYDVYGRTDPDVLFMTINKEVAKYYPQ